MSISAIKICIMTAIHPHSRGRVLILLDTHVITFLIYFFYSFVNLFHHKQISDKIIYVEVVSITIKKNKTKFSFQC